MGMQIPSCLVPQISVLHSQRSHREVCKGHNPATVRMEEDRNRRGERPCGPYPSDSFGSPEIFDIRGGRISERQERNQNFRFASGTEKEILGAAFLGEGILREHRRPR